MTWLQWNRTCPKVDGSLDMAHRLFTSPWLRLLSSAIFLKLLLELSLVKAYFLHKSRWEQQETQLETGCETNPSVLSEIFRVLKKREI